MAGPMTMVLPDDEQRSLDNEPEVAVLERRSVPFSHEKADQTPVPLAHLVGSLVERDPRPVHDREVRHERAVERDEPVIEDRDDVLS